MLLFLAGIVLQFPLLCFNWVAKGALFPLIQNYLQNNDGDTSNSEYFSNSSWFFDEFGLQRYILHACQDSEGGLKDKPGKYVQILIVNNKS